MKNQLLLLILFITTTHLYAETRFSGYIVTKEGDTIWADEIQTDSDETWNVKVIYEGQSISSVIKETEVEKITIIDDNKIDYCYPDKAIVYLSDGRDFELERPNLFMMFSGSNVHHWIGFYKYDPISKELKHNKMDCGNISEIIIDKNKGELKTDSKGNRFPPYYVFSPYTGEKLFFGSNSVKK